MRRRRWARAAALCLAIAVLLQLAAVHCAGASTRTPAFSTRARGRAAQRWPSMPVHHAVPKPGPRAGARAVAFDATATATAAAAGCKSKSKTSAAWKRKPTAGGRDDAACDEDDKRRIPTGPNPLHNR
ncbi:uncharacterized protein [Aegilops tauschii subsp. strangulata]|uniref:uncharacterized protein n=1 Tax=Aegilops tauschii subsp. strangulata TaxID=200361 RepID=UPI0008427F54|nr:uncharacterized protein LOC109737870 [Aegilops tauschii subsp. strangulata]XP_044438063.1 uncharacterized protein LOC123164592 [Triticum aestivum]